ncbi:hypothetical protein [Microbacterium sp. JZ101]
MVVIGRGKGEVLHNAHESREQAEIAYADREIVLQLASKIAGENQELMRRLA